MTHSKSNGRCFPRHVILRQLGHGTLTCAFLAAPRGARRANLRVLEILHPELAEDEGLRALFLDQAAATLSLRHPNIVRTLEVIADRDCCGLAVEFLNGQTLARVLERLGRHRFPVDLHLHVLSKVLAALAYAHDVGRPEPGLVHRDVCPSNVFLTYDGQVKLLGTGFADAVQALEARLAHPLMDVKYAAPEVLLGRPSGPSADLFGVGIMLWEAVTRQARVSSEDATTIIGRRTTGNEPDLESAWPDAPLPLIEICSRALAEDPRARYPTAQAFRADLDAYLGRAAETSDEVLRRLPALMEASFGPERERMHLFVNTRLELAGGEPTALATDVGEVEHALSPHQEQRHQEQWRRETGTREAQSAPEAPEPRADVARTGLRRARPEAAPRRNTGVQESERRPPASARPVSSLKPTSLLPLEAPPRGDATTGGHRAYSSSLEPASRARPRWRLGPDVLGAAALLLGSLVAAYSVYRHSSRDEKPESEKLAIRAEGREPPARQSSKLSALTSLEPGGGAAQGRETGAGAAAPVEPAHVAADAGAPVEELAPAPAFFDGRSPSSAPREPAAAAPLSADDLPALNPDLTSLQDAIVVAAQRQRRARHRREKDAEPAPRPSPGDAMLQRPIDEADPYTEPSP